MPTRYADGKGKPFYCAQHITEASYRGQDADLFYRFDTLAEMQQDNVSQAPVVAKFYQYFQPHALAGPHPQ